jgi:hypothetical protein
MVRQRRGERTKRTLTATILVAILVVIGAVRRSPRGAPWTLSACGPRPAAAPWPTPVAARTAPSAAPYPTQYPAPHAAPRSVQRVEEPGPEQAAPRRPPPPRPNVSDSSHQNAAPWTWLSGWLFEPEHAEPWTWLSGWLFEPEHAAPPWSRPAGRAPAPWPGSRGAACIHHHHWHYEPGGY